MFFTISKILSFLFKPLTWVVILFMSAFLIKKYKTKLLYFTFFVLYFFSNRMVVNIFYSFWEVPIMYDTTITKAYDLGIVLSGIVVFDFKRQRTQFQWTADRIMQAIRLYKQSKIKKIMISGGSGSIIFPDMKEALLIKKYLLQTGIPEKDIIIESFSRNTYENALYSKKVLDSLNFKGQILLISSAYHLRRAEKVFKKVGLKVDTYPSHFISGKGRLSPDYWLIPDSEALFMWDALIHEWVGYIVYMFKGYL